MALSSHLSDILHSLLTATDYKTMLLVGKTAIDACKEQQDTRSFTLTTPLHFQQLHDLPAFDLAIVSNLIEVQSKDEAIKWLSRLRHCHTQHLVLIAEHLHADDWQFSDFLALGMEKMAEDDHYSLFSYNIENYRPKHDWLNSKYWANPENYDKYRW